MVGMPARHGGIGLRSAARTAPAAYWAAWADALPVLSARLPAQCAVLVTALEQDGGGSQSLQAAARAAQLLEAEGFQPPS